MNEWIMAVPEEFSFDKNLAYLKRSADECMFRIEGETVLKAIAADASAAVIEVGEAPGGGGLRIRLSEPPEAGTRSELPEQSGNPEAAMRSVAASHVREWFDLDRNLAPFYALGESDPLLREPVRRFRGLRLMGIPDLFEALCWGIIGQQINLPFAYTLKRRLVERYGRTIGHEGRVHCLFPSPETIAGLTVGELASLRMTVKKCEYLIDTAEAVASGKLTQALLLEAGGLKEAERLLVSRRGIGPWTANYVLMRCLRLPSAFPIDDAGLHNAVRLIAGMDRKPTRQELLELSAGWSGWQAYATFYLWRMLY